MRIRTSDIDSIARGQGAKIVAAEAAYVAQARERHAKPSSNDIEVDENPAVSIAEEGAWVAAWVWVSREEAGLRKEIRVRATQAKKKPAKSRA